MASGLENIETIESPFRRFVTTIGVFPTAFTDAMTYYECLAYLVKYIEETVIPAVNDNAEALTELQTLFIQLKSFVENYFANLDVQEEINNKLDQMVEDGTFEDLFSLMYPVKTEETGVTDAFLPYGDVRRYGAKCDGETDDTTALNNAITSALALNIPVKLHGKIYVSETINTHGATLEGDVKPTASGAYYPDGIGYNYAKNVDAGALITFADYINTIPNGTCIISDIANPIISTDYDKGFKLKNFGVYGWLRNTSQVGVEVETEEGATYYQGHHEFTNFSVFNTGLHGIHLHSIETTVVDNVTIELTNSYGIYIEGLDDIDTPSDYTVFKDCRIRYTRLAGIYFYNTIRTGITFEHCNFNYIGQYSFGEVIDSYGTRSLPVDNASVIYPIYINGLNSTGGGGQLRYLDVRNNYGEADCGFLRISNIDTVVGLNLFDNPITKFPNSTTGCYLYSNVKYLYDFEISYMTSSLPTLFDMASLVNFRSEKFVTDQFTSAVSSATLYKDANKYGFKAFKTIYGNDITVKNVVKPYNCFVALNTSSGSEQEVTADITSYVDTFLKANQAISSGHGLVTALLCITPTGNTNSPSVSDIITIERHNNKHLIGFVTNNTSATADTAGVISITVPAYKVATLQFLQLIDTAVSQ